MFTRIDLEHLLRAHDSDPGCDETRDLLDVYADTIATGQLRIIEQYWRLTIHLDACTDCRNHLHGLLAALSTRPEG